jgi:hypothetical protein
LTEGDLLSKIQELETLLHSHNIFFNPLGNSWIQSPWEKQLIACTQTQAGSGSSAVAVIAAEAHPVAQTVQVPNEDILPDERYRASWLWSELPEDVRSSLFSFGFMLKVLIAEKPPNLTTQTTRRGCRRPVHGY